MIVVISSNVSCIAGIVIEYASADIEYLLDIFMFSYEVDTVAFEGSLVMPSLCLFCLQILYAHTITLAMVDE